MYEDKIQTNTQIKCFNNEIGSIKRSTDKDMCIKDTKKLEIHKA